MNDRSSLDSLVRSGTSARHSGRLAWASTPGFGRRRLLASSAVVLASSRDFLQGTFEKIHFQSLLRKQPLQFFHFSPRSSFPSLRARHSLARFHACTPLVEHLSINPQFLRKLRHIGTD